MRSESRRQQDKQSSPQVLYSSDFWTLFKTSIVEAAGGTCGQNVAGACCGGNPRILWWALVVTWAANQKPGPSGSGYHSELLIQQSGTGRPERLQLQWWVRAEVWVELGEAMEVIFYEASEQTIDITQPVLSRSGEMLTSTGDIIGRWKEHFEDS